MSKCPMESSGVSVLDDVFSCLKTVTIITSRFALYLPLVEVVGYFSMGGGDLIRRSVSVVT